MLEREVVGVKETTRFLKRSKSFVSQYFRLLEDEGVLRREGRKFRVEQSPEVRAMKILLNISRLKPIIERHREEWMVSVGIYGSFARGESREDSDLDIWVRVEEHPDEMEVARVEGEISRDVGRRANILVLTDERLERIRKEDPIFYCELRNSFVIWGEGFEF